MTLYLTDTTSVAEIERAARSAKIQGIKLYPAGATTNSAAGVTAMARVGRTLEAMERCGMALLVHGEVVDETVDIFDREQRFLEQELLPLLERFPRLKVVVEHITTAEAVELVRSAREPLAATITPHHLALNRNAMLVGGIKPHAYCLPVLKREHHRQALVEAATSGDPRFFLGTDSAPHPRSAKESSCGCAGVFSAPLALSLCAEVFEEAGALARLEGFVAFHGAEFYGLPRTTEQLRLIREDWRVPESFPFGSDQVVPLKAGELMQWRVAETSEVAKPQMKPYS